jgi:hypothetical protein
VSAFIKPSGGNGCIKQIDNFQIVVQFKSAIVKYVFTIIQNYWIQALSFDNCVGSMEPGTA